MNLFGIELNRLNVDKKMYFLIYTFFFFVIGLIVFSWFLIYGKSFIFFVDGFNQHFLSFAYFGQYLRDIFFRFINTGKFAIPLWDHSIGYGADVLATLHYYVIGDPLNLLSFFVPQKYSEFLYNFLVIFRLYLAGIVFALYCFKMKKDKFPVFIGAFIYAFCGYGLVAIHTPFFLNPLIYFPLLLIGIEKIFNNEKPYLFIGMVFISLVSNFYCFYMLSCMILIYCAIRIFSVYKENLVKKSFSIFVKFLLYYLIGVLVASIVFIPTFITLSESVRSNINHPLELFYSLSTYKGFIFSFITVNNNFDLDYFYQLKMGYPIISLIAIVLMFLKRGQNKSLKFAFVMLTLFALFPIFAKILNGFSYATNRWIFAYSFLVAFITVTLLPKFVELCRKRVKLGIHIIYALLFALVVGNIVFNAYRLYSKNKLGYALNFVDRGQSLSLLKKDAQVMLEKLNDTSFARTEENPQLYFVPINSALITHLKGTAYYFSLANPSIYKFFDEIEHYTHSDYEYDGLDGRAMLGTLANVKYFVAEDGKQAYIPYGYDENVGSFMSYNGLKFDGYKNRYALPFGYTYSSYIPNDVYQKLSALQKQQAVLQGVALEENLPQFAVLNRDNLLLKEQSLKFEIAANSGVQLVNGKIIVLRNNASITFVFDGIPNSETYIRLHNLTYLSKTDHETMIFVNSADTFKKFIISTPQAHNYIGKKNYMMNLGHSQKGKTSITVTFMERGEFLCEGIEIIALPIGVEYRKQVEALGQAALQNVEILPNKIKGNISLNSNKILVFSVPYSSGWKAFVNGKEVKLLRANTMFMGLPLETGDYEIELRYITPGLKLGALLSLIGLLLLVGVVKIGRRNE